MANFTEIVIVFQAFHNNKAQKKKTNQAVGFPFCFANFELTVLFFHLVELKLNRGCTTED